MEKIPHVSAVLDDDRLIQAKVLADGFNRLRVCALACHNGRGIARRQAQDEVNHKGNANQNRDQHYQSLQNISAH